MTHWTNTLTLWPIINDLDLQPPQRRLVEELAVPLIKPTNPNHLTKPTNPNQTSSTTLTKEFANG